MSNKNIISSDLLEGVRLMRMKQISAYTSLSRPYLYKLIAEGDFPNSVSINGIRVWEKRVSISGCKINLAEVNHVKSR